MEKIRVLVVEDQNVVREGLVAILSFQADIEVVGQAEDGIQAIKIAQQTKPDVILLDLVMPCMDGLAAMPKITEVAPDARILILTSYAESERVYHAIKAGALGYLLKDAKRDQLLQAIRDVAGGQAFLPPPIAIKVIQDIKELSNHSGEVPPLTRRENQILRLIARGLSNKDIARELHIDGRTVAKHVSVILNKLHLANRTQAALFALRGGFTE